MENKKPNNQLAFPLKEPLTNDELGMTLRDYFANDADVNSELDCINIGKIKDLMNVENIPNNGKENLLFWFELEAKLKYMKADAMLKEREL